MAETPCAVHGATMSDGCSLCGAPAAHHHEAGLLTCFGQGWDRPQDGEWRDHAPGATGKRHLVWFKGWLYIVPGREITLPGELWWTGELKLPEMPR